MRDRGIKYYFTEEAIYGAIDEELSLSDLDIRLGEIAAQAPVDFRFSGDGELPEVAAIIARHFRADD